MVTQAHAEKGLAIVQARSKLKTPAAAGYLSHAGLGFAAFQDLLADGLSGGLDFLHLFANTRPGGFVAAFGFAHVIGGFVNEPLKVVIFLHGD
jgi:hypothetical protein